MPANNPDSASSASGPYFLGVDIGGTNIKIGLVDNAGNVIARKSISTDEPAGATTAIARSAKTCRELAERAAIGFAKIPRAGLGTPGPMCLRKGMLLNPTNLPSWHKFPILRALEQALEMPVSFINDANAAALGEFWVGSGVDSASLALLTLGTGVGGGLVVEGKLVNGINSFGSEIGHLIVDSRPDARFCVWGGGQGQLEAYASASALAAQAELGVRNGVDSSLATIAEAAEPITAKHIHRAAVEGDSFALELVDEAAFYLGIGVTCAVHLIDPGLVLLGGAMNFGGNNCHVGRRFLEGVVAEFQKRTFPNVFEGTKIDFAMLGGEAGFIGAAAMAHHDFHAS